MNRIWIAGSSGSGKTTLANILGEKLHIPIYHRDEITWDDQARQRGEEDQINRIRSFTASERWIFEGARFTSAVKDGRLDHCDTIIYLDINRFVCLYRGLKRSLLHACDGSIPHADKQIYDWHHIGYVLYGYPKKIESRNQVLALAREKGVDVIMLKTRKQVARFIQNI